MIVSRDPATLRPIGKVPTADAAAVRRAAARARRAVARWSAVPVETRAAILDRAGELLARRGEEIARLITREEGKPLAESRTEASNTADRIRWFARTGPAALASRSEPVQGLGGQPGLVGIVEYRPRGVIAAIKPWNFPVNIPVWSLGPALLAGNAVLFKPSERTPLCGKALAEIFWEAGVPRDVLQVLQGADAVGRALVAADVEMIAFVGSQSAGRAIALAAAPGFKKVALEMGGKDPAIVLADAPIDKTAEGIVRGAFKNCGQVCCSIERVYVERAIAKDLTEAVVERTRALRIGHGLEEGVEIGPMVASRERDRVEGMVADARRRGAKVLTGGARPDVGLPGYFYAPTILANVPDAAQLMRRETFGPVLPLIPVRGADEAVRRANSLPFGLAASVWSADTARAAALARRIEAGTVAVNRTTGSIVAHPWGGMKSSGTGRLLGVEGIREFAEVVTIRVPA